MLVRRERPDDVPLIDEVHRSAFGTPGENPVEVALVHALRADPGWIPALSLVAEARTGAVVGHVVATEGRLGDVPAVGIGPLGVRVEFQGQGMGHALMHAVVAAADALDYPLAVLLGSTEYYVRFGFVAAALIGVEAPDPTWGPHFQARTLAAYLGQRGTFRYAAPFAAL